MKGRGPGGLRGGIWDSGAGAMAAKYGDAAPFDAQGVSGGGSEALGASTGTIEGVFFACDEAFG